MNDRDEHKVKKPAFRFSTTKAMETVAAKFGKPTEYGFTDWSYIYSKPNEIQMYLNEYESTQDEDIKFVLTEMILQALVDQLNEIEILKYWDKTKEILHKDFELHQFTIHYWMNLDAHNFENCKYLSPLLIELFNTNEERITIDNKW